MRRTALMSIIALLLAVGTALGTEVYWTPAHGLAPQDLFSRYTWGDLDRDGDDDISRPPWQYWNDGGCPGPPIWRSQTDVLPPCSGCTYRQTALGDLDADGDLDVIYGCFEPNLHVFWNIGTSQWQEDPSLGQGLGGYYSSPFLADLDDDGDLDIVIVGSSAAVGLYENVGTPQAPTWTWGGFIPDVTLGASCPRAVLADLDGDADLDLVGIYDFGPIMSWENTGTQQAWVFTRNLNMLTGVGIPPDGYIGIALPDVDCDGDPDMLLQGWSDAHYLYLNDSITPVVPASWGTIKALYR